MDAAHGILSLDLISPPALSSFHSASFLRRRQLLTAEAKPLEDAAATEEIATKVGRPTLAHEPTEQIIVRVPSSLRAALTERAYQQHTTASELTRNALERYLAEG